MLTVRSEWISLPYLEQVDGTLCPKSRYSTPAYCGDASAEATDTCVAKIDHAITILSSRRKRERVKEKVSAPLDPAVVGVPALRGRRRRLPSCVYLFPHGSAPSSPATKTHLCSRSTAHSRTKRHSPSMETFSGGEDGAASASGSRETWSYPTVSQAPPKRPAGRTKFRETRHPVYRGVRQRGAAGRWVCEVREPNKKSRIWVGTFPTADMAARAHDVAAMMLRGRSACLNFADSAWRLHVPPSFSSPRDIARAAAEAAEAFRPPSDSNGDAKEVKTSATVTTAVTATPSTMSPEEDTGGGAFDAMAYDDMDLGFGYYSGMAEGLLLVDPPPNGGCNWDDMDAGADVPLWSHSI
ncbi:hypothetical protein B296_00007646 [Ensete ventricosum]|uniref:AP2/ERF domain-containing protein n=1 Tax=Ensete ventricosum TaxID=4639 RepID=A0A426YRR9_ENSVE|nr:hypothetical protein B296_00007646 [Ensete ventricosum]